MVTVNATDTNNNTSTAQALVTVTDTISPILTCPQSFTVGTCTPTSYDTPIVTDNCNSNLSPVLVAGLSSGSLFPTGATTVTFEAQDLCGMPWRGLFLCAIDDGAADDGHGHR